MTHGTELTSSSLRTSFSTLTLAVLELLDIKLLTQPFEKSEIGW